MFPPPSAAKQRRPKAKQSNRTLWLVGGAAAVSVVLMVIAGFGLLFMMALMPERIASGVAVASIPLGGKTSEEASAALQQSLTAQSVRLTDGSREFPISMSDLGISVDTAATLQAAEDAAPNSNLAPSYSVDLSTAQSGFVALSEQINLDAIPNRDGRSMDIPVMLDRLRSDAAGEIVDGTFELNMITVPAPTPETASSYTGVTTRHMVEQGQELGLISKTYNVSIADIMSLNEIANPDLIYPGQELIIPAEGVYVPPAPAAPTNIGRSIVVSTETQRIYAYENGQMVRSQIVSTGLPATPTVKGDYAVYVKYVADDMRGADYFLPQVPYVMYYYQGYAIHGTYWHNAFGRPMSHGCVNLPVDEAQWFFNFASVSTPVRVI